MAVLLIKKCNFKQGLPAAFGWDQGSRKIVVDESCSLVTDDKDFGGQSRTFEVNNVSDVDAIKDQLCNKPLVAVAQCSKQYKVYRGRGDPEGNREVDYFTMADDFVVVLNTANPDVRKSLDELFEKAKKLLDENAKFVVVFDLDESVKLWYAQVPHENSEGRTAQAMGASFYIAHGAKPQSNCAGCFGCEQPVQKAMWIVCFPCCLVSGVPYLICRKCVQNIKDVKISTRFHSQEQNAIIPPGTNLMSLFHSPPQVVSTVVTSPYSGQQYSLQPYSHPSVQTNPYSMVPQAQFGQYPQPYTGQYNPQSGPVAHQTP